MWITSRFGKHDFYCVISGKEKDVPCPIPSVPKKNPSLIYRQYAIKFGSNNGFSIPAYRDTFGKIEINTHVHVRLKF